jgi:hypothetical protein
MMTYVEVYVYWRGLTKRGAVARQKTIYVKDSDLSLWQRFEKAVRVGVAAESVSALIAESMRHYLAQFGDQGGGLYVRAPDEASVTFGTGISAVLEKEAGDTWTLRLDEKTYGEAGLHHALGRGTPSEMVAVARAHMTNGLGPGELEMAAARLRRALGIEDQLTASDGRAAGREWALTRAAPGELEAICELTHSGWDSVEEAGDAWPTLYAEIALHRPPAGSDGRKQEIKRDDFMVGFVEEACAVYQQILKTERNVAT